MKKEKIAVLLTCFNRIDKTLKCLKNLENQKQIIKYDFKVFIVDDASTDNTSKIIKKEFPDTFIIQGTGKLFWNQGMRLAWKTAVEMDDFDFFIWLNNDTFLLPNALFEVFNSYKQYKELNINDSIVVGACCENKLTSEFSYGLRKNELKIVPNRTVQTGNMMNGNIVLISKEIYNKVGLLSESYTHAMGDYDYGLRAIENGFELITTNKYIAICETNKGLPNWRNPKKNFKERWKSLHSPLGLNIKEFKEFKKRFSKKNYYPIIFKIYANCFFPYLFHKSKNNV